MKRTVFKELSDWKQSSYRKPLLIRGARQVGKTHLVRQLGETYDSFVEINLERDKAAGQFFEGDLDPKGIITKLSAHLQKEIIPGKTLLFIDEIQTTPRAIISLRYFYEEMPELHVIAAGSLIDFAVQQVGVPVGRVQFLYVYPLSFVEFLEAMGHSMALKYIAEHDPQTKMSDPIHEKYLSLVAEYLFVGGMPAAVAAWVNDRNPIQTTRIHQDLIEDYRQDFEKYAKKSQLKYVRLIFDEAPLFLGEPFKYTSLSGGFRKRELSPCLDLLETAGVITRVYHTAAQGFPLGAQIHLEHFKTIFVDVALAQTVLGLNRSQWITDPFQAVINQGGIVESFVGQELLAYGDPHQKSNLYYWRRSEASAQAEVDYVQGIGQKVVPIEVKAGESGWLKSLKIFLEEHPNSPYGLRISGRNYAISDAVHSYPLYAVWKAINASK